MPRLAALILAVLLSAAVSAQAETVHLATLDWPPYIGQDLPGQGYVAEVVREAFARSGRDVEFHFRPWKRTLEETREGIWQGYLPEYHSRALEQDFAFSTPLPGGILVLLAKAGKAPAITSIQDLAPYRLGVVRGYVNTREIDQADLPNRQEFNDDLTVLKLLLRERVDVAVMDLNVARYLERTQLGGGAQFEALEPPLEEKLLYVCFPKCREDHLRLLAAFEKGIMSMRRDGALTALREKHGIAAPLPGAD